MKTSVRFPLVEMRDVLIHSLFLPASVESESKVITVNEIPYRYGCCWGFSEEVYDDNQVCIHTHAVEEEEERRKE